MADDYLGKKFEDFNAKKAVLSSIKKHKKTGINSLDSLILKNRSYRGYDEKYIVSKDELLEIVGVNSRIPSAKNQQVLRFKIVTSNEKEKVLRNIKLGSALPELHLPLKGTAPNAFIIICSSIKEDKWVNMDIGIASQTMLLKATDLGLNGICIGSFNKQEIITNFNLKLEPQLVIAIGKGIEKIQFIKLIKQVDSNLPDTSHNYYIKDSIHFVPKFGIEDLLL
ncbi:MAG: nitroreductase family protein [Bacteroidales bacterium]